MGAEEIKERPDVAGNFRVLFRELRATLSHGGQDLQASLQAIVTLLAEHFHSDVCSLYQLDEERGALFLRATKGLRAEAVGRTVMALGEGLVGTAAQSRQTLALEDAQADPRFSFRPETGEEIYHSLLAVPLIHAQQLLGVLVVQHRQRWRYDYEEVEDCKTVAQFLSVMLHQVTASVPEYTEAPEKNSGPAPGLRLEAVPLSSGIAQGKALLYLKDIVIRRWHAVDTAAERKRVDSALETLEASLSDLISVEREAAHPEVQELLEAELMLAGDKGWRDKILAAIEGGLSAEAAVQSVREDLAQRMRAVSNDYIRARLLDLDDLSYRLLAGLTGKDHLALADSLAPDKILICRSLGTAELLKIGTRGLAGLVVADATPASHLAIIANSLQIPALGQAPDALAELREGDEVIIDAVNGQLIGRPNESVAREFAAQIAARRREAAVDRTQRDLPAVSRCGQTLDVMANAGLLLDLDGISPFPSLGIGLYRTEMAFLIRSELPSVEEQAALYRQVYNRMGGRPVVFRTLDVGSDKALSYLGGHVGEANPALGWRAIRMGLDRPELLADQLRALLMAAAGETLKIMFPMITEVEEFHAARAILQEQVDAMTAANEGLPKALEVGVMLEVPALLWDLDRLMRAADFVSLGTNDLFQFLNAADRNNPKTTARYSSLRAPNLRLLTKIAKAAKRHETPLSVCGELAGTPLGFIALLGCGFRSFSMSAANIAQIKQVLAQLDLTLVEHSIQDLAAQSEGDLDDAIAAIAADFGINRVETV